MSVHVDGFVVPVPRHKLADHRRCIAAWRASAQPCESSTAYSKCTNK